MREERGSETLWYDTNREDQDEREREETEKSREPTAGTISSSRCLSRPAAGPWGLCESDGDW